MIATCIKIAENWIWAVFEGKGVLPFSSSPSERVINCRLVGWPGGGINGWITVHCRIQNVCGPPVALPLCAPHGLCTLRIAKLQKKKYTTFLCMATW